MPRNYLKINKWPRQEDFRLLARRDEGAYWMKSVTEEQHSQKSKRRWPQRGCVSIGLWRCRSSVKGILNTYSLLNS